MADADSLDVNILTRDAALLQDTVREAGALAQSMFRTELKKWTKGASSPVSEADIAVNDLLEARLRGATPDYGWLSEESADDATRLSRRLTWIVDPIDGTRNYLNGHDEWCVSVALVEDASPVLAAVFAPVSNEFFFAVRGQGTIAQRQAGPGDRRDRARLRPGRRPEADGRAAQYRRRRHQAASANRFAGASALPGRQWRAGCGFCGRQ